MRLLLLLSILCAAMSLLAGEIDGPDMHLSWVADPRVKKAERVFPSRHDPDRVWVVTEAGIVETLDDGNTWALMPGTSRAEIGRISDILFSPSEPQLVFAGTRDKGVWRSDDGGKTWRNVGNAGTGLKAQSINRLRGYPGDWSLRTLYATHGPDAVGISRSGNAGANWTGLSDDHVSEDLLFVETVMLMTGFRKTEEDVHSVFKSVDGGQLWAEEHRDLPVTAVAAPRIKTYPQYIAALKAGISDTDKFNENGPDGGAKWATLFTAFSGAGDDEILYAYDPYKHGLLASKDGFRNWWKENDNGNLYVGSLVKEGASISPNANGSVFYGTINGQLYVGRMVGNSAASVQGVKATPAVVRVPSDGLQKLMIEKNGKDWPAKTLTVNVSARVTPPEGGKISKVDLDLSPLRLGAVQLFDDGKHNDGAANDGLYAGQFQAAPVCLGHEPPKRPGLPGQTTCAVRAYDAKGKVVSTGIMVIGVYPMPENWMLWDGDGARWGGPMKFIGAGGRVQELEVGAHNGQRCLRFVSTGGTWAIGWGQDYYGKNASVAETLSFWIKLGGPPDRDVKVFLFDGRGRERMANPSAEVWLFKDGIANANNREWQQVRIPMEKFRAKAGFFYDVIGGIGFGGDSAKGTEIFVDEVMFEGQ